METFSWLWLWGFASIISGKAALDLAAEPSVKGMWKAAATLPCRYEPSVAFKQLGVVWKASLQDHAAQAIFHRDLSSGDQIFTTAFRGRLSVTQQPPGDVSLQIEDLAMTDSGLYTCEVTWEALNKSKITQETMTRLQVVKVPVSKPVLWSRSQEPILPKGTRISLNCSATGSPPIEYRWYKEVPGDHPEQVGSRDVLTFDSLQVSDAGRYYCTAKNRVQTQTEQSNIVELRVGQDSLPLPVQSTISTRFKARTSAGRDSLPFSTQSTTTEFRSHTTAWKDPAAASLTTEHHGINSGVKALRASSLCDFTEATPRILFTGSHQAALPLYLILLIAVLCVLLLLVTLSVAFCRRKTKEGHTYEVAYSNNALEVTATSTSPGLCEDAYEEPSLRVDNSYTVGPTKGTDYVVMKADNEYEFLVNKMESEYEVAGVK